MVELWRPAAEGNWMRYRTEDGFEVLGDGRLLPRSFEAGFPDDAGAPELRLQIEMHRGIPQCRKLLLLSAPGDREIRQSDLRRVDVEYYLREACHQAAVHVVEEQDGGGIIVTHYGTEADNAEVAKELSRARRNTRRKISDNRLAEVADVYRANPSRPSAAVAEHFGLDRRTARLYAQRARKAGLLEEVGK